MSGAAAQKGPDALIRAAPVTLRAAADHTLRSEQASK